MTESKSTGGSDTTGTGDAHAVKTLSSDAPAAPAVTSATHESGEGGGPSAPFDELGALARGTTVGRYLVLQRIGAGAMGVVYAAYDPELDRKIALKLLRPQEATADQNRRQARLVREAKAIARVSHPNVVGIFDVGVYEGQVFMAMEHLTGGTLRAWMAAKRRPWREVVQMFIAIGHGLAGAHAEGLIHRDFKPDNVLLDKNGVPKVVDFGLVRLSATITDLTGSDAFEADGGESPAAAPVTNDPGALTRTGALTGTPAFMAPEQFRSEVVDGRSDQFSFCVALYEALYGERPFAGDNVLAVADSVINGRVREAPKESHVPGWLRRAVLRGLSVQRERRFASFDELNAVLGNDPVARRRRQLLIGAGLTTLIVGALATRQAVLHRRHEIDRRIAENVEAADASLLEAASDRRQSLSLRDEALAAFDGFRRDQGEEIWGKSLSAARAADTAYERGIQRLEAAVGLDPRRDLRQRIADALVDYAQMTTRSVAEREATLKRLGPYDDGGVRAQELTAPATLSIETTPPGLAARIDLYDPITHSVAQAARPVGATPLRLDLPPGSYRVTFDETSTHVGFHYPILLTGGEKQAAALRVPLRSEVPRDFVYVPEGRFKFGSANEEIRNTFLDTVPLHEVTTGPFLIARHETTLKDWIGFLESLPPAERTARAPHGSADASGGLVSLQWDGGKSDPPSWTYLIRPTTHTYKARQGASLVYLGRRKRAAQDWTRFPVTGISAEDAVAFCGWLDRSGRVPGARLCTEAEWEHAARGADGRDFPHGNSLATDDANFDLTYGRNNASYGPDEVGVHPISVSPFGLADMVGNAWEMTTSVLDRGQLVIRGGSFYQFRPAQQSTNRNPIAPATRDQTIGLRVCASIGEPTAVKDK